MTTDYSPKKSLLCDYETSMLKHDSRVLIESQPGKDFGPIHLQVLLLLLRNLQGSNETINTIDIMIREYMRIKKLKREMIKRSKFEFNCYQGLIQISSSRYIPPN